METRLNMAQRQQYSIVYLVPNSDEKRYKQAMDANPDTLADRFLRLNPRASLLRIFNSLTGEDVYAAAEQFSGAPVAIAKTRSNKINQ